MAAQPQFAPQTTASAPVAPQLAAEAALVQSPAAPYEGEGLLRLNPLISRLPVELDVAVPIRKFRVRSLLALAVGAVVASQWVQGEDLPLSAPGAQLAWTEFEVIDQKLAVRITRLV
ncbi:MAG: FliM/FliN family flagellar motor C-terminal domain-containing protein [Terracidiphilus sp.]